MVGSMKNKKTVVETVLMRDEYHRSPMRLYYLVLVQKYYIRYLRGGGVM